MQLREWLIALAIGASCHVQAADTSRIVRQLEQGSNAERAAALKQLASADPVAAVSRAAAWLAPGVTPALRRAAARTLWDLGKAAKDAEPALRAALNDADDDVAYNAVGALAVIGVPKGDLRSARLRLSNSADGFIAFYATRALDPDPEIPVPLVFDAAFGALALAAAGRPSDSGVRSNLRSHARTLLFDTAKRAGRPGFDALLAAYPMQPPDVKEAIASALGQIPPQHGDATAIAALLDSPELGVQRAAVWALRDYHERAAPVLDRVFAMLAPNLQEELRKTAAGALGYIAGVPSEASKQAPDSAWRRQVETRIAPALAQTATRDPERDVRKEAAEAMQRLGLWAGPALASIGERIAQEPDAGVRHALVRACWSARESPKLPRAVLTTLAEQDPDQYVRNEAKAVVAAMKR